MRNMTSAIRLRETGPVFPDQPTVSPVEQGAVRDFPERATETPTNGQTVVLDGLAKSFGDRGVLSDIDLTVPAGQFLAIVGRSGCGKSTLLRLIAGLDRVSGGRITIDHRAVDALQPSVRLLFQDARLLPWQRVIGNVGIARNDGWREAAAAALEDVGLPDRANDWPAVLSGGQRQRVALARALVSRPGVLLLDEPFGALDALTRSEMHRLLERIWTEHGFTTFLITHDVAEAVALADRVIVLRSGNIALDLAIDLPRPRRSAGAASIADLQARILNEV
jgi:sulfonate transport system ATP-binding protein